MSFRSDSLFTDRAGLPASSANCIEPARLGPSTLSEAKVLLTPGFAALSGPLRRPAVHALKVVGPER